MVKHCVSLPEYKRALKQKGRVCMHDITKIAVIPWTKKTRCSLFVLMSEKREDPAKLMISHVSQHPSRNLLSMIFLIYRLGGEDVSECHRALEKYVKKYKRNFGTYYKMAMRIICTFQMRW